jgi:hypothetical protein
MTISFRAYDEKENKMIYFNRQRVTAVNGLITLAFIADKKWNGILYEDVDRSVDGLKDARGVQFYIGDYMKQRYDKNVYEVIDEGDHVSFKSITSDHHYNNQWISRPSNIAIVGNKHQGIIEDVNG